SGLLSLQDGDLIAQLQDGFFELLVPVQQDLNDCQERLNQRRPLLGPNLGKLHLHASQCRKSTPDQLRLFPGLLSCYEIHWQLANGDRVTTHKTYYGTHEGHFLGVAPTHRKIHFETVDVMRVQNGKITDHWGVGNLLSLMQQIGGWTPPSEIKR